MNNEVLNIDTYYSTLTDEEVMHLISHYKAENKRLRQKIEDDIMWKKAYMNLIKELKVLSEPRLEE